MESWSIAQGFGMSAHFIVRYVGICRLGEESTLACYVTYVRCRALEAWSWLSITIRHNNKLKGQGHAKSRSIQKPCMCFVAVSQSSLSYGPISLSATREMAEGQGDSEASYSSHWTVKCTNQLTKAFHLSLALDAKKMYLFQIECPSTAAAEERPADPGSNRSIPNWINWLNNAQFMNERV